ncbi:MAG: PAS-domain containing protein [Alphaproteobacteria bacterium]|nr:PAS-domain containing protein [Alphaproteobacteria bacterium]
MSHYAIVLAIIAAGLVAALALSLHLFWEHELDDRSRHTRGISVAAMGYVERAIDRTDRALTLIAGQVARTPDRPVVVAAPLREAMNRIRHLGMLLESLGVVDADGNVIALAIADDAPTAARIPDAAILQGRVTGQRDGLVITAPFRREGAWLFGMSREIRDAGGAYLGLAYATVDVRMALEVLQPLHAVHGGELSVLTDRFVVLARMPDGVPGADLSGSALAARIRAGESAGLLRTKADHDALASVTSFAVSDRYGLITIDTERLPDLASEWLQRYSGALTLMGGLLLGGLTLMIRLFTTLRRDSRRAERLRESTEAALRDSIECMGEGFVLWDKDERLVLWNQRYPELLPHLRGLLEPGVHLDEIREESARRAFPHLTAAEITAWLETRRARSKQRGVPMELALPDGRTIEVVEHTTSAGGRVSIYRDITAERNALRDLATSEARFRDGIESIADAFILWDSDDRLAAWNRRCADLLPQMGEALRLGISFDDFLRESIARHHPDWTEAARAKRIAERVAQHRVRSQTSEFTSSHGRVIEVRESATSDGGCVSLYRDVTEARRLLARLTASEAELQRALAGEREVNAQQRRFVSMASHEFRTPLAIIDSASQRILSRPEGVPDSDLHKRVERIRGAVARMTEIIERTLSTARLEDGRFDFEPTSCELGTLLAEVCERQRSISPRWTIRLDLPRTPILLEADPRLLDQVFSNLLSNAVKYSGASRRVEVAAVALDDAVEVAVTDHGIGIPEAERDRLFTRFFRTSASLSIPGTGIGLNLVKEFVTLHGGTVAVHSVEQQGSTFTVRLPRRPAAAAAVAAVA